MQLCGRPQWQWCGSLVHGYGDVVWLMWIFLGFGTCKPGDTTIYKMDAWFAAAAVVAAGAEAMPYHTKTHAGHGKAKSTQQKARLPQKTTAKAVAKAG